MAEQLKSGDRNFSQEEAEEILARAAKLSGPTMGHTELSLSDLKKIAQDAGIDPSTLDRAIAELEAKPSWSERIFLGAPLAVHVERTLDRDVPVGAFEQLLPEIQRVLGEVGHVSMLGNTLTWTSAMMNNQGSPTQITISRSGGKVLLRASSRMSNTAGGLLGGIGGGVGGGLGGPLGAAVANYTHSAPITVAAVLGVVGSALLLARTIYGAVVRGKERKLTRLVDRMAELLRNAET